MNDHQLAAHLATEAGKLLVELRAELSGQRLAPFAVGARGDAAAHDFIAAALHQHRPDDMVLSEESMDNRRRLEHNRVWIVDPLDGTREFSIPGRTDWAVHVALVTDGQPTAAAVALPAQSITLATEPARATPEAASPPRVITSRSRPGRLSRHIAESIGASIIQMGSAGAKAAAVVLGEAEVYAHASGLHEWDLCAPAAVAAAAGLHVSHLNGAELRFNQSDTYISDFVICHPDFASAVITR
ncbi:MAG: 3'(2'),5'-bisphosphate nucleotidase CysQ [Acidimicrobiia bacterium]|nr:3'(2'),5'-bisphosphate nucleotidase CysQ [Acidimicrobiia bacterium]MCY4434367.1 3'(2'),5'-bisphosphate nucleotidase CysQ [bacterium]